VLLYRADVVPVGEDQLQHVELMREIARKWNARFLDGFFPEPQGMVGPARRIVGLDGESKMSKSLGNTVGLLDPPERIWELLQPAKTDPARVTKRDPGDPEKCNIYALHQYFSPVETLGHVAAQCRSAGWGCLDCKRVLANHMATAFAPIRERAAALKAEPERVRDVLADGADRARAMARETMRAVRSAMGLLPAREAPVRR
jgi:tryptophanyl-tRNA synthetase